LEAAVIPHIPWYTTITLVVTQPFIAFAVWRILAPAAPGAVRIGLGVFLGGWVALAFALAPSPATLVGRDPFYLTPLLAVFALGSFAVVLLAFGLSPQLRRAVAAASLPAIVGVQFYRILGVLFIILLAQGQLPAHFAAPAGWGDIFVGLTAPVVALALMRRTAGARTLAIAWNLFGLLDLMVAVGMGTGVLAPYLMPELGSRVPSAAAMGVFPLILVPTFAVPLSVILHVIALLRLRHGTRAEARLVARTVS
jgi:hypothetical protein